MYRPPDTSRTTEGDSNMAQMTEYQKDLIEALKGVASSQTTEVVIAIGGYDGVVCR